MSSFIYFEPIHEYVYELRVEYNFIISSSFFFLFFFKDRQICKIQQSMERPVWLGK